MNKTYYRIKKSNLTSSWKTMAHEFPDPVKDAEEFLVQFLPWYETDNQVTYLDDLYKLLFDEFQSESDKINFIEFCNLTEESEIKDEIIRTEKALKIRAYDNFYSLVKNNKIEILDTN